MSLFFSVSPTQRPWLVGIVAIIFQAGFQAGCAAKRVESQSPERGLEQRKQSFADLEAELAVREQQLQNSGIPLARSERQEAAPPAAYDRDDQKIAADEAPAEARSTSTSLSSKDKQKPQQRCEQICRLAAAICELEVKICELADNHPHESRYHEVCARAHDDCQIASEACHVCQP